jgi:hypothetical protein
VQTARSRLKQISTSMTQKSKKVLIKSLNTIDEYDISNQGSSDKLNGDSQGNESQTSSTPKLKKQFEIKLDGPIIVADDQHINIEILKQHALNLGV